MKKLEKKGYEVTRYKRSMKVCTYHLRRGQRIGACMIVAYQQRLYSRYACRICYQSVFSVHEAKGSQRPIHFE